MAKSEQFTEELTKSEMKFQIGENEFGYVFPQGNVDKIKKVEACLKRAGGKPLKASLEDRDTQGKGKAKPEFIITLKKHIDTIIVIECKKSTKMHVSPDCDQPQKYAVDGALYYAKYLSEKYNVVAIGISGTALENYKVSTYYWPQNNAAPLLLPKGNNSLYEAEQYINMINGERVIKNISLPQIRYTALNMHERLREIKVTEKYKPIFVAGILIALTNDEFCGCYRNFASFDMVITNIETTLEIELAKHQVELPKIRQIKESFRVIKENPKFREISLPEDGSIIWYVEELENKIKPMMDNVDTTIDALGVFYHEFIKYSGGDGKGLGIVLTPQHLTEFMCDVANVNKNSKVIDICCGSGAFLVTAMAKMFRDSNMAEIEMIRKKQLYGIELDSDLYLLALANMIIRKDGKSNLVQGDCFNEQTISRFANKGINIGIINPPYSQKDRSELEFVKQMLDLLVNGGTGVAVVPMSCAIGTKYKEIREKLFQEHTLKAVFSMPDDIFYPTGTNVCIMVWEAHVPHDSTKETFFGYYRTDGFEKRKKLGRIDVHGRWNDIEQEWLDTYRNRIVKAGYSALKCVTWKDEWLCEAYMDTDYDKLTQDNFEQTVNNYLAYLVKEGDIYEDK